MNPSGTPIKQTQEDNKNHYKRRPYYRKHHNNNVIQQEHNPFPATIDEKIALNQFKQDIINDKTFKQLEVITKILNTLSHNNVFHSKIIMRLEKIMLTMAKANEQKPYEKKMGSSGSVNFTPLPVFPNHATTNKKDKKDKKDEENNENDDSEDVVISIIPSMPNIGTTTSSLPFSGGGIGKLFESLFGGAKKEEKVEVSDSESEYSDYSSSDEFEDLGIEIKTIDDLIKLGDLYVKLKEEEDKNKKDDDETIKVEPKRKSHQKIRQEHISEPIIPLQTQVLQKFIMKHKINSTLIPKAKHSQDPDVLHTTPSLKTSIKEETPIEPKPCEKQAIKKDDNKVNKKYYTINNKKYSINLESLHKLSKPLNKLKALIGLKSIKDSIVDMILYYLQHFEHKNKNMLHTIIEGPPGVGKTEVGRIIGEIYSALGVIPSNKFKIVKRTDLIGEYVGHTAHKTQKAIDEADGGVLFIDEAYSLGSSDKKDSFSEECINIINQNLSEKRKKLIVIIAGYKDELEKSFFSYNPGLRRRFPFKYTIDGYSCEELRDIFVKKVYDNNWKFHDSLDKTKLFQFFKDNMEQFPHFGGDIENLLLAIKFSHSRRMFNKHPKLRRIIVNDDLNNGFARFLLHKKKKDTEFLSYYS